MKTIQLDDIQIDKVVELEHWTFAANELFPAITPEIMRRGKDWLDGRFINHETDTLVLGVHSYLLRIRKQIILVDTCNGNQKNRPSMPSRHQLDTEYLANLNQL